MKNITLNCRTPKNLFDKLGEDFHFNIDVRVNEGNAKYINCFSKEDWEVL